jgi:hypothetical protein
VSRSAWQHAFPYRKKTGFWQTVVANLWQICGRLILYFIMQISFVTNSFGKFAETSGKQLWETCGEHSPL